MCNLLPAATKFSAQQQYLPMWIIKKKEKKKEGEKTICLTD